MKPAYVDIYAENFTEPQLDDILAFYRSPTGQVLVEKLPALTAQAMQIAQSRVEELQPQVKQLTDDFVKQMSSKPSAAKAKAKS